jgi:hypothetical protein
MTIQTHFVRRPSPSGNITGPTIFREVDAEAPTLMIDEISTFLIGNKPAIGILNTGHYRPFAFVKRTEMIGKRRVPVRYSTFSPVIFGCTGALPTEAATAGLEDRCIVLPHRKRGRNEIVEELILTGECKQRLTDLGRMAARWVHDNLDALVSARPVMPGLLPDRARNNWKYLFSIADLIGGQWPDRLRKVALMLTPRDEGVQAEQLIADMMAIFHRLKRDRIATAEMLNELAQMEDREWFKLSPNDLAKMLRPFGIKPKFMRYGGGRDENGKHGYVCDAAFLDAWERYAVRDLAYVAKTQPPAPPPPAEPETGNTSYTDTPPAEEPETHATPDTPPPADPCIGVAPVAAPEETPPQDESPANAETREVVRAYYRDRPRDKSRDEQDVVLLRARLAQDHGIGISKADLMTYIRAEAPLPRGRKKGDTPDTSIPPVANENTEQADLSDAAE